jgi:hypothetical protein
LSNVIELKFVIQNAHNNYTHKLLTNINSPTTWKNLHANGAHVSIKNKLT